MPRSAKLIWPEPRRILVLLLTLAFLSASPTCVAMALLPLSSGHPCCQSPAQPDQDQCPKMGCVSPVPALPPESVPTTFDLPVIALTVDLSAPLADWHAVPTLRLPEFEVFLR